MPTAVIAFPVIRSVQYEYFLPPQSVVLNGSFHHISQGEISGLLNLTRTLGGEFFFLRLLKGLFRALTRLYHRVWRGVLPSTLVRETWSFTDLGI